MENNIIVSGYESIKAGLLENEFVLKNNIFAREISRQKIIEVNGQQFAKDIKTVIKIEYLGEGYIETGEERTTIYGFAIKHDKDNVVSIWAQDFEEFRTLYEL